MIKQTGVVIGCGAIAREHLAVLAEFEHVDVAAVCDISPVRAEATADRYSIPRWYTDHEKLLSDVRPDLVHITTPPAFHAAIAKDCLTSGLNVLCEKPLTVHYSDFLMLKQLAIRNNLILMENQQNRFHSSIIRIGDLIASGKLGDVLEVQICISLNVTADRSLYTDQNAATFCLSFAGRRDRRLPAAYCILGLYVHRCSARGSNDLGEAGAAYAAYCARISRIDQGGARFGVRQLQWRCGSRRILGASRRLADATSRLTSTNLLGLRSGDYVGENARSSDSN